MGVEQVLGQRVAAVRRGFSRAGADCLIVTKKENVSYLSGFAGEDSWLLVTKRSVYLLTDSRYTEQASIECVGTNIVERHGGLTDEAAKITKRLRSVKTAAVEDCVPVGIFNKLRRTLTVPVRSRGQVVEQIRAVKGADEVAAIRKAAQTALRALGGIGKFFVAGITEKELAGRLEFELRRLGTEASFETIVAFGANASRPHHRPTQRRLRKNDSILIDFGAQVKGYCSDITRCFTVGKVSRSYRRAFKVVERARAAGIAAVQAQAAAKDVDAAARDVVAGSDFPVYGHGTGHGLGLEVHEKPVVSPKSKQALQAGEVITIEPGIYVPGEFGIRLEDDVLVTGAGCEVLSREQVGSD